MLNVDKPAVVGVPLIAPVVVFRVSPTGRVPVATDHVYGAPLPPDAVSVCAYDTLTTPPGRVCGEIVIGAATAFATHRLAIRNR
jgi:hypothetical protein